MPSGATSLPIPSPGITAMLNVFICKLRHFECRTPRQSCSLKSQVFASVRKSPLAERSTVQTAAYLSQIVSRNAKRDPSVHEQKHLIPTKHLFREAGRVLIFRVPLDAQGILSIEDVNMQTSSVDTDI